MASNSDRVRDYLSVGGLFNPELLDHEKVRDLIVDLAEDKRSVCPDCGNGWTFDFLQKRIYCRTCESAQALAAVDRGLQASTDQPPREK